MPRKPANRISKPADEHPVVAEQRRLRAAQDELLRKQRELERVIQEAPTRIEKQRRRNRNFVRINVTAPVSTTLPGAGLRDKFSSDTDPAVRRRRPRKSERTMARVQFLILCLILMTIVFLIWRSIG